MPNFFKATPSGLARLTAALSGAGREIGGALERKRARETDEARIERAFREQRGAEDRAMAWQKEQAAEKQATEERALWERRGAEERAMAWQREQGA